MATASGGSIVQVGEYDILADDINRLGSGATGTVYYGYNRFNQKLHVAGKKMTIEAEFFDDGNFQHESNMLLHTIPPHENIIKIFEVTTIPYQDRRGKAWIDLWIVMEYGELGDLKEYAKSKALTLTQKVDIIFQCALAVNHLHQCRPEPIVHRDIKPENYVLLKQNDRVVAKLVDFGYARTVQRVGEHSVTLLSLAGTRSYQAPEQTHLKKGQFHYNKSVDLFSLALTILAVLDSSKGKTVVPFLLDGHILGFAMWQMMSQQEAAWRNFVPNIDKPEDGPIERDIKRILKEMLRIKPIDRIGITEVMERLSAVRSQLTETDPTAAASTPLADKDVEMDDAVGAMSSLGIRDDAMDASSSLKREEADGTKPKRPTAPTITRKATHEAKSSRPSAHSSSSDSDTERRPAEAAMRHLDISGSSSTSETKETRGAKPKPKPRTSLRVKSKSEQSAQETKETRGAKPKPKPRTSLSVKSKSEQSAQETRKTRGAKPKHQTSGRVNEDKSTNPISPSGNVSKNAGAQGRRSGAIEVQEIAHHKPDFTGHWIAGLGCHGEIILTDWNSRRFFTFKYEGNRYTASMERDLPDGVRYDCYKSMNSRGELFFQQRYDKETLCCNRNGKVITTLQHKGELLDIVGDLLMYGGGTWGDWSIEVHEYTERGAYHSGRAASEQEASRPVLTLKPPAPYEWGELLSVCSIYDDRYVVVERKTQSLDTFNGNGEHIYHTALTYSPAWPHGVTAWSGHIMVAEEQPPALHIYTDSGEHVASKTHKQLGLDEVEYVHGIRCDSNGVLHVCVGDWLTINSLHAFQIKKC